LCFGEWPALPAGVLLPGVAAGDDTRIWIVTDAEDDDGVRVSTLILLPEEY